MDKINFNITEKDRSISRSLSQTNNNQSLNNDSLTANIKTLTSILTDMNSSFEVTAKKLKEFSNSLNTAVVTTKETSENTQDESNLISKIGSWISGQFGGIGRKKGLDRIPSTIKDMGGDIFKSDESTSNIMKWTAGMASAASDAMTGNYVGAAMNVGKTISSIISANRQANKELKLFYSELEQATLNYSIKVIAATKDIQSSTDSIFDTDKANKLAKGMTGFNDAQKKLMELEGNLSSQNMEIGKKKRKFLGVTTGTKTIWGNVLDNYKNILGTDEDLIDKETKKLDLSIANSLKESGKLSKEATTTLNNMIAVQTAADAAMQQVNQILSDQAGKLGDNLQTALVKAFQTGETAANDFSKSVSDMLESIVVDQMFNSVFGEMLKELEDEMKKSFSDSGDQDITDDISRFYNGYGDKVGQFNEGLEKMQEQIKGLSGLDILPSQAQTTTQSSSSGSFSSMSQDQAGELTGLFTGLHMTTGIIGEDVKGILDIHTQNKESIMQQTTSLQQLCSTNIQSMYYLEDIKKNTNQLHQINERLGSIQQNTSRL